MVVQNSEDPMIVRAVSAGGFLRINSAFGDSTGLDAQTLASKDLIDWIHPEDAPAFRRFLNFETQHVNARHCAHSGEWRSFSWQLTAENGESVALGRRNDERGEYGFLRWDQDKPREGEPNENLVAMVRFIEANHRGKKSSVLILDPEGQSVSVGAGPSLPKEYNDAVEGLQIGPTVGSCGTAAFWNTPVIVEDIQADPLWRDLKTHALKAGLHACWSHPIRSASGDVLGAIALYDAVPGKPSDDEMRGLATAARMVGLEIERGRAQEALHESELTAKGHARILRELTNVMTAYLDTNDWASAKREFVTTAVEFTHCLGGVMGFNDDDDLGVVLEHFEIPAEPSPLIESTYRELFADVMSGQKTITRSIPSSQSGPGLDSLTPTQFLAIPIQGVQGVVGMIGIHGRKPFGAAESAKLETICRAASVVFDSHERQVREVMLEEQLKQAATMESIGVLAGGIAHDFNNMLVPILGNAELASATLPPDSPAQSMLRDIAVASHQATDLCNQMLAYAGRGITQTEVFDCNDLVESVASLLHVALSKKTVLNFALSEEPLQIEANKSQVRQVLMNLITNASESVGDRVGTISVSTRARYFNAEDFERFIFVSDNQPGAFIEIRVEDDGAGMSESTKSKMFEPFYTTKFAGRGLGLAAVQGIVRSHHGAIYLKSEEGKGTILKVLLPRSPTMVTSTSVEKSTQPRVRSKTVLLVDDEVAVRDVNPSILKRAGFDVITATDGEDAIQIFEEMKDSIDCVLLDLSMPRLDGEETFSILQSIQPDVRVVINSGYTEREMLKRFEGIGFAGFLQKPTPMDVLVETIRSATRN